MKEKGGMDNKSTILTNKIKDAIIFILTLIYFVLTCLVIILNVVAPLTFSLIIFDVLWAIYIVIEYNLFNFALQYYERLRHNIRLGYFFCLFVLR